MRMLEFIFSSFWVFLGVVVLIAVLFDGLTVLVRTWRHGK